MKFVILLLILVIMVCFLTKIIRFILKNDITNIFIKYMNTKNDKKSMSAIINDIIKKNDFKKVEVHELDDITPSSLKTKEVQVLRQLLMNKNINLKEKNSIKEYLKRIVLMANKENNMNKLSKIKIDAENLQNINEIITNSIIKEDNSRGL